MNTVTRCMTSGEAELLREHRTQMKRGVRQCLERMATPASGCLGFVLCFGFLSLKESAILPAFLITLALLPVAVLAGATWYWHEFRERQKPVRECEATLKRGQVIEEHYHPVRAAEVNLRIAGMAGMGPVESADYFYDLGNGSVLYISAMWRHGDDDGPHPRREVQLVYTDAHKMPLSVGTAGEPLEVIRAQTAHPIDLPNGTILPGGLDAVLAAVGAKMKVQPAA